MKTNFAITFVATLRFAAAMPIESAATSLVAREEKREEGIYTYYTMPPKDKGKREEGIYTYYTIPGKEKEKREEGIYTYYTIPAKEEGKRSPQDFADDAVAKA